MLPFRCQSLIFRPASSPGATCWLVIAVFLVAPAFLIVAGDPAPKTKNAPDAARVQRVLLHLRKTAETNAGEPANGKRGDELANRLVREMAGFCVREKVPVKEFLMSLGVGLDSSDFLRRHPLTRNTFQALDQDAERDRRRAVLGEPSLRKRTDWLQHFALSAALTASSGPEATELLGIAKELQDALGPSGFSFADLGADYAGIALAKHLLARPDRLADIAKGFRAEDYLPSLGDLEEGIPLQALSQKYGDPGSETFRAACRSVRDRIDGQGVYKTAADKKTPAAKE